MDIKTIHQVFREEKAKLNISLRHAIKPYSGTLQMEGSQFIGSDDVFQIMIVRGKIRLFCNQDKTPTLTDRQGRLILRHELCHVLDFLFKKIGHNFHGIAESSDILSEALLVNAAIAETQKTYCEFLMARRYIKLFGVEEFKEQNEIGMADFIALCSDAIAEHGMQQDQLSAFHFFIAIFGSLKEVIKVNFYNPRDPRFAGGVWQIVAWLVQDFEFIESLPMQWRERSSLLCFEALAIFENVDLESVLRSSIARHEDRFSSTLFSALNPASPLPDKFTQRWTKRIRSLAI